MKSLASHEKQCHKPQLRAQAGLTLTEMLIAIGLIAALCAIVLPVFQSARLKGQMAVSTGNLKMMSHALHLYIAEQNGQLPEGGLRCTIPGQKKADGVHWFNALAYYLEGSDFYPKRRREPEPPKWLQCPGRKFERYELGAVWGFTISVGYGWNWSFLGYAPGNPSGSAGWNTRITEITHPAETIVIGTNHEGHAANSETNALLYPPLRSASTRFNGKGLFLFVDGHVQLLSQEEAQANERYFFRKKKPVP